MREGTLAPLNFFCKSVEPSCKSRHPADARPEQKKQTNPLLFLPFVDAIPIFSEIAGRQEIGNPLQIERIDMALWMGLL